MSGKKKCSLFLLYLLCAHIAGSAQGRGTIKVDSKQIVSVGNDLLVKLIILGENLDINPEEIYKVEIYLEDRGNSVSLPSVIYTNTSHHQYDKGNRVFYSTLTDEKKTTDLYKLVKKVNKYIIYWTPYDVAIPYEPWMKNAVLKIRCISQKPVGTGVSAKEEIPVSEI